MKSRVEVTAWSIRTDLREGREFGIPRGEATGCTSSSGAFFQRLSPTPSHSRQRMRVMVAHPDLRGADLKGAYIVDRKTGVLHVRRV